MVRVASLRMVLLVAAVAAFACLVVESEARSSSFETTLDRARRSLERSVRQVDTPLDIPKQISALIYRLLRLFLFQVLSPTQFKMLFGEDTADTGESLLDD